MNLFWSFDFPLKPGILDKKSSRVVCGSKYGLWNATEETNTLIASVNKRSTFLFRSKIVTWEGPGHDFNNLHSVQARMVCSWRQMVMDGCGSEKRRKKRKNDEEGRRIIIIRRRKEEEER